MTWASEPAHAMTAAAKSTSYFRRRISGCMIAEIAATSAEPEPEIAASPVAATTETISRLPTIQPTSAVARSTMRLEIPPASMIAAGEYEERDRHDRERVEAVVHALRDDRERDVGLGNHERGGRREPEHEHDRHPDEQEHEEDGEREDHAASFGSESPSGWPYGRSHRSTTLSTISMAK